MICAIFSAHIAQPMPDAPPELLTELDERQQGGIQVIARMSRIMRALSANTQPGGLSLSAIASEVDLPRSTVQRIINALVAENMVEPAGPTGFRIGPALGQLIYQTQSDIVPVLKPHVEQLSLKLQETVCLVRLQIRKLQVIDAAVGEQILRIVPQLGIIPPMHLTAAGKAMLAQMEDAAVREWIRSDLPARSASASRRLLQEIEEVRRNGYATEFDEVIEGVSAMACAIATYRGNYAFMVLAPTVRLRKHLPQFRDALLMTCAPLQEMLTCPQANTVGR